MEMQMPREEEDESEPEEPEVEERGDAEAQGPPMRRALSLPDRRMRLLETQVNALSRKHKELQTPPLLKLGATLTHSAVAPPTALGAHLRRKYLMLYAASAISVEAAPCDSLQVTVGCASHVQGRGTCLGVTKLLLAVVGRVGEFTHVRGSVATLGPSPEADVTLVRSLSPHCEVQQRFAVSEDGASAAIRVEPMLSRSLRGSLGFTCGNDPGMSLGLLKRSTVSGHLARVWLSLRPEGGEIKAQLKYKPDEEFSLRLEPSLSSRGPALHATCCRSFDDGVSLTKLMWGVGLRQRGVSLRLTLCRAGLRYSFPLELWPEANGPLPLQELSFALAAWVLPPLLLHSLYKLGRSLYNSVMFGEDGPPAAAPSAAAQAAHQEPDVQTMAIAAAHHHQRLIAPEALRRREEETAQGGLVVLSAKYGDALRIAEVVEGAQGVSGVIDVTDCLMAKVRHSRLAISEAPKSSLLGFYDPRGAAGGSDAALALAIWYRYGGVEHKLVVGDTEALMLP